MKKDIFIDNNIAKNFIKDFKDEGYSDDFLKDLENGLRKSSVYKEPLARLVGIESNSKKRIAGLNQGEIRVSDDFDAPLPDEFWLAGK